jgi:hypothetical protein
VSVPRKDYDLTQIIDLMKANKVLKVKLGSLEVELDPAAFADESQVTLDPRKVFADPLDNPATADELLFWSVGGSGRINSDGEAIPAPALTGEAE